MARKRKEGTQQGNATVVTQTWRQLLAAKHFVRGFNEVRKGLPFNDDDLREPNHQWSYERGRLFGVIYSGKLKDGNKVLMEAVITVAYAAKHKFMI